MSEWAGPKGKPPTRPHKSSRLRNEVLVESTDDERTEHNSHIQVPGSDVVIPETQLQHGKVDTGEFGDDLRPGDSGSDHPMSPNSLALLSRNHVAKSHEAPGVPLNVQFLSRPSRNEPLPPPSNFFFKPARKATSTQIPQLNAAPVLNSNVSAVVFTAPEPVAAANEHDTAEINERGVPQANLEVFISSAQEEEEPPTPTLPEIENGKGNAQPNIHPVQHRILENPSHRVQDSVPDIASHPAVQDFRIDEASRVSDSEVSPVKARHPYPPSDFATTSKWPSARKTKKGQGHKQGQDLKRAWPPRSRHGTMYPVQQRRSEQAAPDALPNAPAESFRLERVKNGSLDGATHSKPFEGGQADVIIHCNEREGNQAEGKTYPEELEDTCSNNREMGRQKQKQEHEQGFAPATPPPRVRTKAEFRVINKGEGFSQAAPPAHRSTDKAFPIHNDEQEVPLAPPPSHRSTDAAVSAINDNEDQVATGTAQFKHRQLPPLSPKNVSQVDHQGGHDSHHDNIDDSIDRRMFEGRLHQTSSHNTERINKARKKSRTGGASRLPPPKLGYPGLPTLSSENDAFVKMLHLALGATESKARDATVSNTKAHETAISSLRATIGYQDNVIQSHKEETARLQGEVKEMKAKVTTLAKHANGIGQDYSRINGQVKDHQRSCSRTLMEKIAEIESEKSTLIHQLHTTLDSFDRTRRNMKSVLDDCYTRLVISESKKVELAEQLCNQHSLYKEERKWRSVLEQQIMPTLNCLQKHVENSRNALSEKLGNIQGSLDNTTAEEERDARLKQCLDALHGLQTTPFLTAKDLQKAEGMLRAVHKSIGTKLDAMATSVQVDSFPLEDLQSYIYDQVQNLRSEVLKYDEAVADYRKAEHANEILTQQIDAQKECCAQLEVHIHGHRQKEDDLRSRYAQLEQELLDLKGTTIGHDSEPSELEQELTNLRHQMSKTEDALRAKSMELDHANERLQEQGIEVAKSKQLVAGQKAQIMEQIKQMQQNQRRKAPEVSAEARQIDENHRQSLKDLELSLGNEMHRLRAERDEYEASVTHLTREVELTRDKMQRIELDFRTISSESDKLREAKAEADKELKMLRQTAAEGSTLATALVNSKQQLAQKTVDYQHKERELLDLCNEHAILKDKTATWQEEKIRMESKLAETLTTVGTIQKALDARTEAHEIDAATVQELRNQAELWRKEKQDLEASVDRSYITEFKFNETHARLSIERDSVQTRLTELRTALETREQELQRTRLDTTEQTRIAREEITELRRRLILAETAVKEADARSQCIADEKDRQLEDHKRTIDEKVEDLVREKMAAKERERHRQGALHQLASPIDFPQDPPTATILPVHDMSNAHVGRPRKRVNRQNSSVLSIMGPSRTHQDPVPIGLQSSQAYNNEHWAISDVEDNVDQDMMGDLGRLERLDEDGVSILNNTAEAEVDTQPSLTMTFDQFKINMTQEAQAMEAQAMEERTSSSLSDPPSSDIVDMNEPEAKGAPILVLETQKTHQRDMLPPRRRIAETPSRTLDVFEHDPHVYQSQDRPRSQANTALRIAPPVAPFEQSPSLHLNANRSANTRFQTPKNGSTTVEPDASSPDYIHLQSSVQKTYGHHIGATATSQSSQRSGTPQSQGQKSDRKRKSTENHAHKPVSFKRYRSSSRSLPPDVDSRAHQKNVPVSGTASRHRSSNSSQGTAQSSQTQKNPGEPTRHSSAAPKRSRRIAKHSDDVERFEKELRPAQYGVRRRMR